MTFRLKIHDTLDTKASGNKNFYPDQSKEASEIFHCCYYYYREAVL